MRGSGRHEASSIRRRRRRVADRIERVAISVKTMSGSCTRRTIRRSTCILRSPLLCRVAASKGAARFPLVIRVVEGRRTAACASSDASSSKRVAAPSASALRLGRRARPARRSSDRRSDRALENARLASTIATSCSVAPARSRAILQSCASSRRAADACRRVGGQLHGQRCARRDRGSPACSRVRRKSSTAIGATSHTVEDTPIAQSA